MHSYSLDHAHQRVKNRRGNIATYGTPQAALHNLTHPQSRIHNTTATVTAVKLTAEQYTALCEAVGLDPEITTVTTMVARILEHLVAAEESTDDPGELKAQAIEGQLAIEEANRLRDELNTLKAQTIVNEGLAQGKLMGWQRDAWIQMAKDNPEQTKQAIKDMSTKVSLTERGYAGIKPDTNRRKWF